MASSSSNPSSGPFGARFSSSFQSESLQMFAHSAQSQGPANNNSLVSLRVPVSARDSTGLPSAASSSFGSRRESFIRSNPQLKPSQISRRASGRPSFKRRRSPLVMPQAERLPSSDASRAHNPEDSELDAEGESDWESVVMGSQPLDKTTVEKVTSPLRASSMSPARPKRPSSLPSSPLRKKPRFDSLLPPPIKSPRLSPLAAVARGPPREEPSLDRHTPDYTSDLADLCKANETDHKALLEASLDIPAPNLQVKNELLAEAEADVAIIARPPSKSWTVEEERCLLRSLVKNGVSSLLDWDALVRQTPDSIISSKTSKELSLRWNYLLQCLNGDAAPSETALTWSGPEDTALVKLIFDSHLVAPATALQQFIKSKENARRRTIGAARTRWSVMKKRDLAAVMRAGHVGASAPKQKTDLPIVKPSGDVAREDVKPIAGSSKTLWTKFEDDALLQSVIKHAQLDWKVIHAEMAKRHEDFARTTGAVGNRWRLMKKKLRFSD